MLTLLSTPPAFVASIVLGGTVTSIIDRGSRVTGPEATTVPEWNVIRASDTLTSPSHLGMSLSLLTVSVVAVRDEGDEGWKVDVGGKVDAGGIVDVEEKADVGRGG